MNALLKPCWDFDLIITNFIPTFYEIQRLSSISQGNSHSKHLTQRGPGFMYIPLILVTTSMSNVKYAKSTTYLKSQILRILTFMSGFNSKK